MESAFLKTGGADYGLIELYSLKYVDAKPPFQQILKGWRDVVWLDKQHPRVCHLGHRTGQSCGAYLGYNQTGIFQFRGYVDSGDSGGPVYTVIDNELYAVGIISYRQPADATRVSAQDIGPAMKRWVSPSTAHNFPALTARPRYTPIRFPQRRTVPGNFPWRF